MGCCLSTKKPRPSSKSHQHSSSPSSRAPPPVLDDVETVKEVLSETPNLNTFMKIQDESKNITSRQNSYKFRQHQIHEDPNISDVGSTMSESVSTTTFDDDIDVYRRKVIERSPAKTKHRNQVSGEVPAIGKSPVREKEQSPGRVRLVPERNGRGSGFGSTGRQRTSSGNVPARSRSPANRMVAGGVCGSRNEIGRSLSGRRTGKSPGRVGSDLHERVRKPEIRPGRESTRFPTRASNDESLENPLVSLECFIFL